MKKAMLTVLGTALLVASTAQLAGATEHHHARKVRAAATEQFRNSNNAIVSPAQPGWYSDYSDYNASHMNMVGH